MDRSDTIPPDSSDRPESAAETLRALEQRLDRASAAAERLLAEAVAAGAGGGEARACGREARAQGGGDETRTTGDQARRPPAAGFQPLGGHHAAERGLEPLLELVRALRDLVPPDLQRRLAEALRELLLALRALIDYCAERLERRAAGPAPVRDIPIL